MGARAKGEENRLAQMTFCTTGICDGSSISEYVL